MQLTSMMYMFGIVVCSTYMNTDSNRCASAFFVLFGFAVQLFFSFGVIYMPLIAWS